MVPVVALQKLKKNGNSEILLGEFQKVASTQIN